MKVLSWNVNGLRASIKNAGSDLKGLLNGLEADIICFQETKATRDQLDVRSYSADGYSGYFSFCRTRGGYSGVVTFCRERVTPYAAEEGLTGILAGSRQDTVQCYSPLENLTEQELVVLDAEGRSVITEHLVSDDHRTSRKSLVVINVYCPMVDESVADNQSRMEYKLKFYAVLRERCKALEKKGKFVLVVGDFNCAMGIEDSAYLQEDPGLCDGKHVAREWMQAFVAPSLDQPCGDCGDQLCGSHEDPDCLLLDTFRYLHPTKNKSFTCWSTLLDCRKTNYGTRIDYILCSRVLGGALHCAEVWQHIEGSDHCPVFAEFDLTLVPSKTQPSLSSTYFSFGKQQKLSEFFFNSQAGPRSKASSSQAGSRSEASSSQAGPRSEVSSSQAGPRSKASSSQAGPRSETSSSQAGPRSEASSSQAGPRSEASSSQAGPKVSLKRKYSDVSCLLPTKSRKQSSLRADKVLKGSQMLLSFTSARPPQELSAHAKQSIGAATSQEVADLCQTSLQSVTVRKGGQELSSSWKSVLTGPPEPPLCKAHNEPCILRKVKKPGPNLNRQFWVCCKPHGSKDDPSSRCNFFVWK